MLDRLNCLLVTADYRFTIVRCVHIKKKSRYAGNHCKTGLCRNGLLRQFSDSGAGSFNLQLMKGSLVA